MKYLTILFVTILMVPGYSFGQVTPDTLFNGYFRTECGGWIAGDATYSIDLPNGKVLWLFGDSFIGTANPDSSIAPGAHMIRNCAILQDGDTMSALYNGTFENPDDFVLPPQPDSSWFWPEHGLVENDTLKIIMSEFITNEGPPGWNFEYHAAYIIYFTYPGIVFLDMELLPYYEINNVMYGNQLMVDGEYTYIYGRKGMAGNIPYIHIARTATGHLNGPWEFYDGNEWTSDPSLSAWISFEGVSQQYAVFKHQDKYVLLTQQIWLGTKIYTLTANQPEGPWGNKTLIYDTPLPFPDMFTYNAWAHPQFNEDNELLVSYNSNGDFWEIFNNVELYRPRFIRVPFEMIDTSFVQTSVPSDSQKPTGLTLNQNFPNPVQQNTTIGFSLNKSTFVSLKIYDQKGQVLKSILNKKMAPGTYQATLDLGDLPPGTYYYRILDQCRLLIRN